MSTTEGAMDSSTDSKDANPSADILQPRFYTFNLMPVIGKVVHVDNWAKRSFIAGVKQYRNSLLLRKKYPDLDLSLSKDIKTIRQSHILYTTHDHDFFLQILSPYFYHYPRFIRIDLDAMQLKETFEENQKIYKKEFDSYIYKVKNTFLISTIIKSYRKYLANYEKGYTELF